MTRLLLHPLHGLAALLVAFLALPWTAVLAQDINGYTVHAGNDLFVREFERALQSPDVRGNLPLLDCSIEYLRRTATNDIMYRRGPIPLAQYGAAGNGPVIMPVSEPESGSVDLADSRFVGGLLIDLPRAGEVEGAPSATRPDRRYMVRAAVVPLEYTDRAMRARIVIERAVVRAVGTMVDVERSEVFAREVTLTGNEPLNFALPTWDSEGGASAVVSESVNESVLITLETPRHFGFSRNMPEPFDKATLITYAVPRRSTVTLSITILGREITLDSGVRNAGRYSVDWKAGDIPDGVYSLTLTAADEGAAAVPVATIALTRDHRASSYQAPDVIVTRPSATLHHVAFAIESGLGYQFPADNANGFRNMFTHLTVRLGYRFSPRVELGVVAGQEAFHERPSSKVDVEKIADYGGVVGITYGYAGGYLRLALSENHFQPIVQTTVGFTSAAPLIDVGIGVRSSLFPAVEMYLLPMVTMHLKSETSTKLGIHYGMAVRF